jgi:glycosyltransferase involved in cell wall biosynthesis
MADLVKIVQNPNNLIKIQNFVQSVHSVFEKEGITIYKQRNEIKVFEVDGLSINVKRYRPPHLLNRIIYSFFRKTKAERAFSYAFELIGKEIFTPEPLAYIIIEKFGLIDYSYYISLQVTFEHTMYEFGKGGISGREDIVMDFARYTASLHEKGIYHRDYSPGNILFQRSENKTEFCLVDINRMSFGEVSIKQGCANFARLWGQKQMFELIAQTYSRARDFDEKRCSGLIFHFRTKFWDRFQNKRPLPFAPDEIEDMGTFPLLTVILSTYNQPEWLEKVIWGYESQTTRRFEMIIADDGSDEKTTGLISRLREEVTFKIKHVWHKDDGFRKCRILNKAILAADTDYLLFSDGDCIPRNDFVVTHLMNRKRGHFLSGGYFKLTKDLSDKISKDSIFSNACFNLKWLRKNGLNKSFKNNKLNSFGVKRLFLNSLTTTKTTWNGHNVSGWLSDIMAVNGFDERMAYGGEDRELGERLVNNGITGIQIRYSAICIHLDHSREYVKEEMIKKNNLIRKETKKNNIKRTSSGIEK